MCIKINLFADPKNRNIMLYPYGYQISDWKSPQFADGQKAQGVVYDGRDTGTVVCPNADVKIFITASPEVRAMRRHKEFVEKGMASNYEEVLAQTKERDLRDSSRATAPLKPADDAIIIDTSNLNIEDVFNKVCEIIDSKKQ